MRDFNNTRLTARAEASARQRDLISRIERDYKDLHDIQTEIEKAYDSGHVDIPDGNDIPIKQFICTDCGLLADYCKCKAGTRESCLTLSVKKPEKLSIPTPNERDFSHDGGIIKPQVEFVKPKLVSGGNSMVVKKAGFVEPAEAMVLETDVDTDILDDLW